MTVRVESTAREMNRPERTTYQITDTGRATLREWLDAMLRTPACDTRSSLPRCRSCRA